MPIYEFQCDNCGQAFEELVFSSSAIDQLTCPECGSQEIHKLISTFASKVSSGSSSSFSASSAASCSSGSV